ncbi:diguanylate cyclase [Rheinheimera maricola]|uniref:diguanylate cyclase n=1 Tax=Rheinheimera maricola TaxID=2793282 RepID=A0ABS7X4P1_9GAMM|nr:diguanylate cyclase [Rheinheimera maricola]MBZ9610509.1 diguanylate cyclase [Rheinheimera maricola]
MHIDSFRARLVGYFGGLILLVSLVLTLFLDRQASNTLSKASGSALYGIANSAALMLERNLAERERETSLLSKSYLLKNAELDSVAVQQRLEDIKATYKYYAWIGVATPDGAVVAATDAMLVGQNVSQRQWFVAGLTGSYLGDVHKAVLLAKLLGEEQAGQPLRFIDFAAPVYAADNSLRAVVASHVNWDWVQDILASAITAEAASEDVEALVLGENGNWLHPFAYIGKLAVPESLPELGQVAIVDWPDEGRFLTTRLAVNASTSSELGWQLVVRQPISRALQPVDELNKQLFILCFFTLLLSIMLAYQLARRFSYPIERLADSAEQIALGGEHVDFAVNSSLHEFSRLSLSLGKMMEKLAVRRQELEQANTHLEQQVVIRTADLERANAALQDLSHKDALTGICNRRAADERLKTAHLALKRGAAVYAVMLLDIDHFKQVNDNFGHEAGDKVIQQVANLLQDSVRETDIVARYGGEEFIVVLAQTEPAKATLIAEKLRAAIAADRMTAVGQITASIGVAIANIRDTDAEAVVRRADAAMYQAKRTGRNRVQLCDSLLL